LISERVASIALKRESIAIRWEFSSDDVRVGAEGEPSDWVKGEARGEEIDVVIGQFTGDAGLAGGRSFYIYILRIYISETSACVETGIGVKSM
jgi:hypothetical protein